MSQKRSKKALENRKIAMERVKTLFNQAELAFSRDEKNLSDRYVELARKIAMKYNARMPSELKKRFCRHCSCYLVPGHNCRVRLQQQKVVYYCLECKKFMRFPYSREIKHKRKAKQEIRKNDKAES